MLHVTISKRAAFIVALALLMLVPAVALAGSVFDDVDDTDTHIEGITFMKDSGVSIGCDTNNNYCPQDNVTRAQMGTFMYRLSGNDPATDPSVNAATLDGATAADFASSTSTETIDVPADAMSIDPTSTVMSRDLRGILWAQDFAGSAYLIVEQPPNWNGGDVVMDMWFTPTTATAGVVDFFARPRSFDVGDSIVDIINLDSAGVAVSGANVVHKQTVDIPASRLGGDLWYITIQREGAESTYPDDVVLMNVSLTYGAER